METIRLTMAQALLKFMDNQFVEFAGEKQKFVKGVLGIFGHGNVTGLGEALEYSDTDLEFITGHNEQGLVHAATAYAKQKNRLGIFACTSSVGPGALNMVTGAATATVNRIPVLLLPGDTFACRQPDPVLQQVENASDYSITANDAFKAVSKYWDRIDRPEKLMTACLNAFRVLTDPAETGAVTICLPQDTQAESYDYPLGFFKERTWHIDPRQISKRALSEAVNEIEKSEKPVMIAGGGVMYSFAAEILGDFAKTFSIPVAETQAGKSTLSWDHEMSLGGIGVTGTKAANDIAEQADLVIAVGTRLADFTTASKTAFSNPDCRFIQININPFDGYKMDSLFVNADASNALEEIREELLKEGYRTDVSYRKKITALKNEWEAEVERLYSLESNEGNVQTNILGELNNFIKHDDIVVCAAGSLPGDFQRLWRPGAVKSYHMEYGFSCMGYEVAAGFGVKMACPDNEVYVVIGDGSYLMLHTEILTSIREGFKVNVIVMDNHGYQCIKNLQQSCGSQGFGNEFRRREKETGRLTGRVCEVDFTSYAAALGVKSFFASNVEEFRSALEKARDESSSTLIEIKTLPGSMSHGYNSWWRVGVADVSSCPDVKKAGLQMNENIAKTRKY